MSWTCNHSFSAVSYEYESICSDLWPSLHLSVLISEVNWQYRILLCSFVCLLKYLFLSVTELAQHEYLYLSVWSLVRVTFWFQGTLASFSFLFSHPKRAKPFFPIPLAERDRVPNPAVIVTGSRSSIPRRKRVVRVSVVVWVITSSSAMSLFPCSFCFGNSCFGASASNTLG